MNSYGQHMSSVTSSMNHLDLGHPNPSNPNQMYYNTTMTSHPPSNEEFFPEFTKPNMPAITASHSSDSGIVASSNHHIVPVQPQQQSSFDPEALNSMRNTMTRMMSMLERLEQRINRVEQVSNQILKNQQESFQVPFMSQKEIDTARSLAEQLEQDTSVAKQLQAAYNKEVEVRKHSGGQMMYAMAADCPICGARVNQTDLEMHVDQCLEMFSNDPKKQVEVKDTKQKVESGFFSRMFNKTKTETTTSTKVVQRTSSTTTPSFTNEANSPASSANGMYPAYPMYPPGFHPMAMPNGQGMQMPNGMPMMMPMYMMPGYGQNPQNE
eukprot:TRINITY_DN886_c0_g1_i1.p1 TRINITY_DN886_c0_g1~~TRINITY_DN886_c0_g1_i1.p1  ORF type:complete len:324 (+),score=75.95 TRINITY_DN886_c0_g1_i1:153-1124(+)